MTRILTNRWRLNRIVAFALVGLSLALSLAGCASKKPATQPNTVKEFLSRPRPQ